MIHQYQLGGYHIVLDVCSGSVHSVDPLAYDMIALYEAHDRDTVIAQISEKYADDPEATPEEIIALEKRVIGTIRDKYGIELHPEVEHVGAQGSNNQ